MTTLTKATTVFERDVGAMEVRNTIQNKNLIVEKIGIRVEQENGDAQI